jgi:UDP-glucose 4-epimerase
MRHLVTGSSGFIGSHLVRVLTARGDDVIGVDVKDDAAHEVAAPGALDRIMCAHGQVDWIWHLAAYASEWGSRTHRGRAMRNAVMGARVIEAARDHGVKRIVFTSSVAVYGHDERQREDVHPNPCDPYGISKFASEMDLMWSGVPYTILRLHNVYGPGQHAQLDRNAVAILMRAALSEEFMPVFGGDQVRCFTYIGDVTQAFLRLVACPISGLFNFGSNEATSLRSLAYAVAEAVGVHAQIEWKPERVGEPEVSVPDHKRAESAGLAATTSLATGLDVTAEWMKAECVPSTT